MRATRAIIHLNNFYKNIELIRGKIGPHVDICFVVKANAYGHGMVPMAEFALKAGVNCLAVASINEGIKLRQAGINTRIFVFSQSLPEEIKDIIDTGLIPLVNDEDFINALSVSVSDGIQEVHLKVDTGMGRLGCRPEEAVKLAALITGKKNLKLGGVMTHFSVADSIDPEHIIYTKKQIASFLEIIDEIRKAGINPGQIHAANSGAICFHDESFFDMVRLGILAYGYSPAEGVPGGLVTKPIMELRSAVVFIKKIQAGEKISYGCTWTASENTYIGVLPIGYADGLPWLLSNQYSVLIRGKAYPIIGVVCMDQCVVNLGNSGEVQRWDEAVIFGPGFSDACDIANKFGGLPFEILCNINERVPRVYINE